MWIFIKKILILVLIAALIWLCLPQDQPVKFNLFGQKIDFVLNPPDQFRTKLGLDLKGGSRLVFVVNPVGIKSEDVVEAVQSARNIIEKRVNYYGLSEPVIQSSRVGNEHRITVELPGLQNPEEAISLIGQTARLKFMEEGKLEPEIATSPAAFYFKFNKDPGLGGEHIEKATVGSDPQNGKPAVNLQFTDKGAKIFAEVTKRNIGKQVAIMIDGQIITAPTVENEIVGGRAMINKISSAQEAQNLTIAINSGALPVSIKLIDQKTIGTTLGAVEIEKSLIAGLVGLAFLVIFMLVVYRKLGMIAVLALLIYGILSFATMRLIGLVFTLPGIAGFILAIGMAVDANILIFERIREELAKGKQFALAARVGFGRAIDAIKDANTTTLLVAFILFNPLHWAFLPQFGLIRGFALTLGIGVITSLFTGVVITKRLLWYFYKLDPKKL